jgi:hypothetical protein
MLQDFSDIIRSVSLSRVAVETSTPEQIVHMTARAIEENLIAYAAGEDHRYRWLPQVYGVVADIENEIRVSRLSPGVKDRVLALIGRAASGWPS